MTLGELADYAKSQFTLTQTKVSDWRPAGDMYVDDLCFPFVAEGKDWVSIPNGIRFWLENGDSIIYVKNKKAGESEMKRHEIISSLEREIKRIRKEPKEKMFGILLKVDEAEDIVAILKEQDEKEDDRK